MATPDSPGSPDTFRERVVGVDNSKVMSESASSSQRAPLRPPQAPKPTSSLSMLLARKLLPKRSSPPVQTIPTQNNQFSCQNLLEAVTKFQEVNTPRQDELGPSPLMSLEYLRLYAAEDDGTPDYELPEFDRTSSVVDVGVLEFAVVDSARNSHVMHVRVSNESSESQDDYNIESSFQTDLSEEPDVVSHDIVEYEQLITDMLSDEGYSPRDISSNSDDDSFQRRLTSPSSPPLPHPIIGTWTLNPPSAGVNDTDAPARTTSSKSAANELKPSHPSSASISSNASNRTGAKSNNPNADNYIISCRVAGSSTWSVAGRVSLDRLSLQSLENADIEQTALLGRQPSQSSQQQLQQQQQHQPKPSKAYPSFMSDHVDDGPHSNHFYSSRPRRVLVSFCESDSDSDRENNSKQKQKSKQIIHGNGQREYRLAEPISVPSQSVSPESPTAMHGFFGDMSPPTAPALIRNIDTGEMMLTTETTSASSAADMDSGANMTFVTPSMLFGKR
jgi:hypothetical protein